MPSDSWKNPFADPELTYKGKTARQRGDELIAEEQRRDLEARIEEKKGARKPATAPETEPAPAPGNPPPPPPTSTIPPLIITPGSLIVQELPDRYRLLNVDYNGEKWNFDWLKKLLDNNANKTQDGWSAFTQNGDVKLPNSMMLYANVAALYANRNHPDPAQKTLVEKVVAEIFKPDSTKNYPHTSTRLAYQQKAVDTVIHNLHYHDQFIIDEDIVGPNARLNSKPAQEDVRAVVLGLDGNDWFDIYADDVIGDYRPARGVVASRAQKTP
ncbi:hypothetical protein HZB90_04395 [archaeon]|nr:hypothetical protein [archaeon]